MCTPVSSTYKADCHDITYILFESAINHHNLNPINIKHYEVTCIGNLRINDFCVQ